MHVKVKRKMQVGGGGGGGGGCSCVTSKKYRRIVFNSQKRNGEEVGLTGSGTSPLKSKVPESR